MQNSTDDEYYTMIDDCMKRESKLTEWEQEFIQNVHEQDRKLSEKQRQIIENIWDRVT